MGLRIRRYGSSGSEERPGFFLRGATADNYVAATNTR